MEKTFSNHAQGVRVGLPALVGPPTRAKVDARAHELAALAGRPPPHVTQSDYQQAKRELTGETDLDRQNAILDAQPSANAANR